MARLIQAEYFSAKCEVLQMEVYSEWWCEEEEEQEEEAAFCVIQMLCQNGRGPLSGVVFTHHKPVYYIDIQVT